MTRSKTVVPARIFRRWSPTRRNLWAIGGGIALAVVIIVSVVNGSNGAGNSGGAANVSALSTSTPRPSGVASSAVPYTQGDPGDPVSVTVPSEGAAVAIADRTVTDTTAAALLATLPIKGRAPKTGYQRTADFGAAWLDVDHNGCDTRNDILARDLLTAAKSGSCRVVSGSFVEPYTGKPMNFVRGESTSSLIQIDHLVALSDAWQTGAQQLSQTERISLANDPINLLAVDGRSNMQKSDGDAATWLPANKSFRCAYVTRQVSVKATYGLWVTQAEHDAMARILSDCPGERALTSPFAPARAVPAVAPEPVASQAPAPAPVRTAAPAQPAPAAPGGTYYANCAAARAAGAAPIRRGEPGYSSKLDRDGDGIACEK